MLSFEWDKNSEQLEVHADHAGLEELILHINRLISSDECEHVHLMSKAWGGVELSDDRQNQEAELINHVKLFKWD
uniref:Immunity protein 32 n=1 Tax=Candidatus Kentrum sp. UNK TaxID=2126344 RepID=A0A451AKM3_9GAMM|nr:MAG: Immunity protein 32 [Candidatus Kentron sp. UNK]VFK69920.1 MAG: Immunity protein 32 [Candidatus Kentron sp. UNK]